jgi:predicted NACHT family NTPase
MINKPLSLAVKPVIHYPREAEVGKTYLMTIDLQPEEEFEWQYDEEEYPIYCKVDSELFSSKPVGEPVIVLHRFGGSYGESKFLLTAIREETLGEIKITLINKWGVPTKQFTLNNIRIVRAFVNAPNIKHTSETKVVEKEAEKQKQDNNLSITILVQEVRQKIKPIIQKRCGRMRVLDMIQPIGLDDIYTDVYILEKITGRQRLDIAELAQNFNTESDNFARFGLGRIIEERISGLKAVEHHSKLMVLGKPGAGKTTFLKYLALQCISGQFQPTRVPIFIALNQFAKTRNHLDLLEFITQELGNSAIKNTKINELLSSGSFLVLLDGLDEVREVELKRISREIERFSEHFSANHFVVTCRIAARENILEKFTKVEISDFDNEQTATFVRNWFARRKNPVESEKFIQKLNDNERLQELATNPLLLIFLCLRFEELLDFPSNMAEFYHEGSNILLRKWDAKRNIVRDQIYKNLSSLRKEDLLSYIALKTFEQENYFFTQENVKRYISDYIQTLPDVPNDLQSLTLNSEAILKLIEAQHGLLVERARSIYSFSHLTFHEYFTARSIARSANISSGFQELISHLTEKRWWEVFLLTCNMLVNADELLISMKVHVDQILAGDATLQNFLGWLDAKAKSIRTHYKPVTLRALYFAHTLNFSSNLIKSLDNTIFLEAILTKYPTLSFQYAHPQNGDSGNSSEIACDITLTQALLSDLPTYIDYSLDHELAIELGLIDSNQKNIDRNHVVYCACVLILELVLARASALYQSHDAEFQRNLQDLRQQLPLSFNAPEQWWNNEHPTWVNQLRTVIIEHRNIGHEWQFNNEQKKKIQQYYDANRLLIDCLNSGSYISHDVRQEIEKNLLLPLTNPS